jgi:hypothetical protein
MRTKTLVTIVYVASLLGSSTGAFADDEPLPEVKVRKQSDIPFVSGGIGELGRKAMTKVANKYPMQLVFTVEGGAPDVKGVKVTVRDIKGTKQIEAVSEGPLFYFNPPSGRWTMDAEYDGETVSRTVDLIGRRYILLEFHFKGAK